MRYNLWVVALLLHTTASWSGRSKWLVFIHQDLRAEQLLPLLFLDCLGWRIIAINTKKVDSNPLLFRFAHHWFHLPTTIEQDLTEFFYSKLDWRVTVLDFSEYLFQMIVAALKEDGYPSGLQLSSSSLSLQCGCADDSCQVKWWKSTIPKLTPSGNYSPPTPTQLPPLQNPPPSATFSCQSLDQTHTHPGRGCLQPALL